MKVQEILVLLAVGMPVAGVPVLAWLGPRLGRWVSGLALLFPVVSTGAVVGMASGMAPGMRHVVEWAWIPSLDLPLSFLVDGLSVFFGLIVCGVGVLVFYYSHQYFHGRHLHLARYYSYLTLFMASMLGTVFSNHVLLLFIFWELTGLASFLLIGFDHTEEASRRGARRALLVTAGTGLLLMVGLIVLGENAGSYRLDTLLAASNTWAAKDGLNMAFLLVALGAFGKSAQVPFHFWLPGAMAAPTPVSAYLHSATMVKLGVFLVARLFPIFQGSDWWMPLLTVVGFTTLWLGTTLALLSHDLKMILAFSTVSQLGYLIGSYGLAEAGGIDADYLHILNHVFYKGALFMLVGVVDHAAGTRDLRELGGLWRRMPAVGVIFAIAVATMAGMIGTTGFVSKEILFKEIFAVMKTHGALGFYAAMAVFASSVLKVAVCGRMLWGVFFGREPAAIGQRFHVPAPAFIAPPAVLAGAALLFGCMPTLLEGALDAWSVTGLHAGGRGELAIWHGLTPELGASVAVLLAGFGLFAWGLRTGWRWAELPGSLQWDLLFERGMDRFSTFCKVWTSWTGAEHPARFLLISLSAVAMLTSSMVVVYVPESFWSALLTGELVQPPPDPLRMATAALVAMGALGLIGLRSWTAQVISLSVSGFLLCFYYVLYHAPDLALTQILVETVSLILILYVLARFPRSAQRGEEMAVESTAERLWKGFVAVLMGGSIVALHIWVLAPGGMERVGPLFVEHTVALAEGANAVNTILVDFRGFDTLGEIAVLLVAMLGVVGLLMRYKRTPAEFREGPLGPPGYGIHHN
ncbi:MAG: proton-conducting transporter membrane subunit [Verrucomicrobiota bacterium]|nr:DUF4040 domain-containing protein [Limisphaera sp.]MDW8382149.1 proton-conducting transporter membrane subunit [Verrucomicrobiota bacterium]